MKRIGLSKSKKMEKIDIVSKSLAKKESRKVETGKFIKIKTQNGTAQNLGAPRKKCSKRRKKCFQNNRNAQISKAMTETNKFPRKNYWTLINWLEANNYLTFFCDFSIQLTEFLIKRNRA